MSTERLRKKSRPDLAALEELTVEALTAPRALTPQVLADLLAHHEVEADGVPSWLRSELPDLETYEQDLLLSPLFTPDFAMRLRFEEVLAEGALETPEVDRLIERIATRGLDLTLLNEGEEVKVRLPDVVLDRFVRLLHLDAELPEEALDFVPLAAEVRCYLRDRAWRRRGTKELLPSLLQAARGLDGSFPGYVEFLTDFVRSHRPGSREECLTFLDNLALAYEEDLRKYKSGERPFFNPELKASYAGKWGVKDDVLAEHARMIAMARALRGALLS